MSCERCPVEQEHHHASPLRDADYRDLAEDQKHHAEKAASTRKALLFSSYNQCERKKRFVSPEAAKKAARMTEQPEVHEYHCTFCGGFHIGKRVR